MRSVSNSGGTKMKKRNVAVLAMAVLCLLLMGSVVHAFNQADFDKLVATNQCAQCDLSGANLTWLVMHNQDLNASNMSKADLSGTDLSGTDIDGANLAGADLRNANLSGADLSSTDLRGANLSGANLTGTNFDGAKLDNAIWSNGQTCKPGSVEICMQ